MKDVSKPYRLAIFNALNGNISVPVFDEKVKGGTVPPTKYVLLSTQQSLPSDEVQGAFCRRVSIDLEILSKTGRELSKDDMDDISNEILEILFPDYVNLNVDQPDGFTITQSFFETEITRAFEISPTESIIRKFVKITSLIIQ